MCCGVCICIVIVGECFDVMIGIDGEGCFM